VRPDLGEHNIKITDERGREPPATIPRLCMIELQRTIKILELMIMYFGSPG
jgi:hypothetical protein